MRDARITAIYEGTNGIQSIDLVTRKLAGEGGASVWALLDELIDKSSSGSKPLTIPRSATTGARVCAKHWPRSTAPAAGCWSAMTSTPNDALAGATPYLRLFGSTLGGCMLAEEALAARDVGDGGGDPQR